MAPFDGDDRERPVTDSTEPIGPEELADRLRTDARELAASWPEYDLDFTPDSLARLDTLVATELSARSVADLDPDGRSLQLGEDAMAVGGYFATVLIDHLGAEWIDGEGGPTLTVPGPDVTARLHPVAVAVACTRGEDSFVASYEAVRGRLDLDVDPIDADVDPVEVGGQSGESYGLTGFDADRRAELATEFAASWPGYDLDFTPGSLARLDDLVAAEYGPGALDSDGLGCYLGEALVRNYGLEWADSMLGWVVRVADSPAADPDVLVLPDVLGDCLRGTGTFALVHDSVCSRLDADGPDLAATGE